MPKSYANTLESRTLEILGLGAALPCRSVVICMRFASDAISYGQVIHQTGLWSAGLLVAALAITPLRKCDAGPSASISAAPPSARGRELRLCGAAHRAYTSSASGVPTLILKEGLEPELATGWLAFAIFVLLAVTSNDRSVRSLGRTWKQLHRWVYGATILMFVHWWLASFDATVGYVLAGLLVAIELLRLKAHAKAALSIARK